jgi:hypothetical protein
MQNRRIGLAGKMKVSSLNCQAKVGLIAEVTPYSLWDKREMRIHTILLLAALLASALPAQEKISPVRKDLLDPFMGAAGRYLALAKGVPEEKYSWRPMEVVCARSEVFVHMAGSTLVFCSYAGLQPPAGPAHDLPQIYMKRGFEMPEIFAAERAIKGKAQTVEVMDQAFHLARDLIRQRPHRAALVAEGEMTGWGRLSACGPASTPVQAGLV